MALVKNETNSTEVSARVKKSVFDGPNITVGEKAREIMLALNAVAADIAGSQFSVRSFTYAYIAKLVNAAHEFAEGGDVTAHLLRVFKALNLPEADKGQDKRSFNPYLSLVRAADGEWVEGVNKRGVSYTVWKPNRSGEKYAAVCRFAVTNGFTGEDLLDLLGGKEEIDVQLRGQIHKIKPTLNAIIAFDRLQFATEERAILNREEWRYINRLNALAEIPYTQRVAGAFTLSEGAVCEGLLMVRDGKLLLLGDSGRTGNALLRTFKSRLSELERAYASAVRKPDTPAEVPAEVLVDD